MKVEDIGSSQGRSIQLPGATCRFAREDIR